MDHGEHDTDEPIQASIRKHKNIINNRFSDLGLNRYNSNNHIDYESIMKKTSNN